MRDTGKFGEVEAPGSVCEPLPVGRRIACMEQDNNSMKRTSLRIALLSIFLAAAIWAASSSTSPISPGTLQQSVESLSVPAPEVASEKPWTTGPVQFVGFGDSMTAGFGATDGRGYFQLLADPKDKLSLHPHFPALMATNYAISGTTSLEHLERQLPRIPVAPKEVRGWIVVTSGGNDIIHNYGRTPPKEGAMYGATLRQAEPWIANYQQRLETILIGLKDRYPGGCDIFLANIYDPTDGVGDIENAGLGLPPWPDALEIHTAYNEVIASTADRLPWVHLVDIHSEFLGHGIHHDQSDSEHYRPADTSYWYYANLEDPNDLGYEALRRIFLREMRRVAAQKSWP